jgi:putative endonuclease
VKGRSGPAFGSPAEAVTNEKQRRIILAAEQYLARQGVRPICRFDVVSIVDGAGGGGAEIEIFRGAFESR